MTSAQFFSISNSRGKEESKNVKKKKSPEEKKKKYRKRSERRMDMKPQRKRRKRASMSQRKKRSKYRRQKRREEKKKSQGEERKEEKRPQLQKKKWKSTQSLTRSYRLLRDELQKIIGLELKDSHISPLVQSVHDAFTLGMRNFSKLSALIAFLIHHTQNYLGLGLKQKYAIISFLFILICSFPYFFLVLLASEHLTLHFRDLRLPSYIDSYTSFFNHLRQALYAPNYSPPDYLEQQLQKMKQQSDYFWDMFYISGVDPDTAFEDTCANCRLRKAYKNYEQSNVLKEELMNAIAAVMNGARNVLACIKYFHSTAENCIVRWMDDESKLPIVKVPNNKSSFEFQLYGKSRTLDMEGINSLKKKIHLANDMQNINELRTKLNNIIKKSDECYKV